MLSQTARKLLGGFPRMGAPLCTPKYSRIPLKTGQLGGYPFIQTPPHLLRKPVEGMLMLVGDSLPEPARGLDLGFTKLRGPPT